MNTGFEHSTGTWICYGFLHFSYLMMIFTPFIESKEYISKTTSYTISSLYFVCEIVFAFIYLIFNRIAGTKFVISVQVILTAIYFIVLFTNLITNETTKNKENQHNIENDFIKIISAKAKYIESIMSSPKEKNRMNNLYYTIHSSPIKSCSDVTIYEEKLVDSLDALENAAEQNNETMISEKITEVERLINKRNFILKAKNR
jgi:hypothetical protein